ncbi:hypothetical protein SHJG_8655 [Streptomyces hygroscopicus subsp. jinggangensis 5008]|nr:hypothetical protein SHJG_8655 [Streptomyces hygroscopicus subsp. jinggangensis 5008]AGF68077.1 hypothetical protein SHJGH_8415 [Streptomyces hygroscopicus subsp. jinggangensis TL01]
MEGEGPERHVRLYADGVERRTFVTVPVEVARCCLDEVRAGTCGAFSVLHGRASGGQNVCEGAGRATDNGCGGTGRAGQTPVGVTAGGCAGVSRRARPARPAGGGVVGLVARCGPRAGFLSAFAMTRPVRSPMYRPQVRLPVAAGGAVPRRRLDGRSDPMVSTG